MIVKINNEQTKNKELIYELNFWTGKQSLSYDGVALQKVKRNVLQYNDEMFIIKGNNFTGFYISMFGNSIQIERKLSWYEILLPFLSFLTALVVIIVGSLRGTMQIWEAMLNGGICGGIAGGLYFTGLALVRKIDKLWLKILFLFELIILSFLISYLFTFLIFKA